MVFFSQTLALLPVPLQKYTAWLNAPLFTLGDAPVTFSMLLKFALIILLSYTLAAIARKSLSRLSQTQQGFPQKVAHNLSRFVFYFIFIIGLLFAMSLIGLNFTTIAVLIGAFGVGIGFGFQSIVQNVIAGLFLLMEKHVRIGHVIQMESGLSGKVVAIRLRATILKTFENSAVLVPNAELISQKVINFSLLKEKRRLLLPFSVAFGTNRQKLSEILIQKAQQMPYTANGTKPQVLLSKIGESGLEFQLSVLIETLKGISLAELKSLYLGAIEEALSAHNIEIPYPVIDLRTKH
ncbi:MAG: mechanosensitive ion channel domain-containing protein [Parachlamydiales bacterium]